MIPAEYRGKKFLSNVEELRYTRGGKASDQVTIRRAVEEGNRNFVEGPVSFTFHDDADIDVDRLLRTGAITLYAGSDVAKAAHTPKADAGTEGG